MQNSFYRKNSELILENTQYFTEADKSRTMRLNNSNHMHKEKKSGPPRVLSSKAFTGRESEKKK